MSTITYLGNQELLTRRKVGFLAASRIAPLSVLPTFDWAANIAQRDDVSVVIGCHSYLEKETLDFLLRGRCGIVVALHRGMYKKVPEVYQTALDNNRLLLVTQFSENVHRPGRANAHRRNQFITELSDEMVLSSLTPESSLYELYDKIKEQKPVAWI